MGEEEENFEAGSEKQRMTETEQALKEIEALADRRRAKKWSRSRV